VSSHHFVKEGQEPALILAEAFSITQVSYLLEWAPLVVTLPDALDSVLMWRIKTDVVLLPAADEKVAGHLRANQDALEIRLLLIDEHPLESALRHVIARTQKHVHVWGTASEATFRCAEKFVADVGVSIVEPGMKWSAIAREFSKWYPENAVISIYAKSDVEISGPRMSQTRSGVQIIEAGLITVRSKKSFWVGEFL